MSEKGGSAKAAEAEAETGAAGGQFVHDLAGMEAAATEDVASPRFSKARLLSVIRDSNSAL